MKNFYKEYEMLSAYIDGELNQDEISYIESKLAVSKDLQQKLAELQRIKELSKSCFNKVPQSPYFETRLISNLTEQPPKNFKFKKWIPALVLTAVTFILMLFLKSNPNFFDDVIEEQKNLLTSLYQENLIPLFASAGLTSEDIFDFALYRRLPLDKERGKYLILGSNENGAEFFEVKTAGIDNAGSSFEKFIKALNLNQKQKQKVDSILSAYASEMESQVLVNQNNTVAISPKLWNYNKAIFADLMAFAKEANRSQFVKIAPIEFQKMDKPQLIQISQVIKTANNSDYIFFTPDTIFVESFTFDKKKYATEMNRMKKEIKENLKEIHKNLIKQNFVFNFDSNLIKLKNNSKLFENIELYFDTNVCRVVVPNFLVQLPNISDTNFEGFEAQIDEATKNLNSLASRIPEEGIIRKKLELRVNLTDSSKSYNYNFSKPNFSLPPDAFNIDSSIYKNNIYRFKADSLAKLFKDLFNDTMMFDQKEFRKQMEEFQREMKKLREEMMRLQKDLRKDPIKTEKTEPIEI